MSPARSPLIAATEVESVSEGWARLALPAGLGLLGGVAVLAAVAAASPSTWQLLGAGRGLIPEEYHAIWGFLLTLATMIGQVVGWAGGSALGYYVLTRLGLAPGWATLRLAATIVYLGLVSLPLLVYHVLFGGWLLGLPRPEVYDWLQLNHPDAYWLLGPGHPVVDLALVPLTAVFLGLLWKVGEGLIRRPVLHVVAWLVLVLSSLAVALSLTIHATLVHLRLP